MDRDMKVEIVAASACSAEAIAACFTAAFDGYLAGSIAVTPALLPTFVQRQGADLALSRCVRHDGAVVGVAFVGRTALGRRIAGMGVRPEARGTGAARRLLQQVIDDARGAHVGALELEVFAQNTPALRLYRSIGFIEGAPLWGFTRAADAALPQAAASPHRPRARHQRLGEAAEWLVAQAPIDLPFQAAGHGLRHADPATRAWRLDDAVLAFIALPQRRLVLSLLFDADPAQRSAQALVCEWLHAHPGHAVRVPQVMRDDVAARALRAAGFEQLPLHQLQMRMPLHAA